ncbi:Choline-sulfatase [Aquisphaera giovannonii]|uniref:Choline-sulfatase n=2 Tax=Aquisphaera giovannonii TaxID=406548 RepID=A0A5B9VXT5_9BACT|nr:Choline-sulfatase [Aquisphaera giovannonii]
MPVGPEPGGPPAPRLPTWHYLVLSLWCGLLAGPLEVAAILVRKRALDLNQFYWMSRHFVWLIPLTNLLIFATLAPAFWLLSASGPRGRWFAARSLCTLTLLPALWTLLTRLYSPAVVLLAMGIAAWLMPSLGRHGDAFRRCVTRSLPVLALVPAILFAWVRVGDALRERGEAARPLPASGAPNLLVVVLDTVAAGHLSLYGYDRPTSPTLDGLARRGVRFDRAQAPSSWTLPSHASLFTGRWPHELSAGWLTPLDSGARTLAEHLGSRGYATAGFVANTFYCGSDSGLARGFATYRDYIFPGLGAFKLAALVDRPVEGLRALHHFLRARTSFATLAGLIRPFDAGFRKPASAINRELRDWLSGRPQKERPFFAFLNYYDVHYPYLLPEGGVHRFAARPRTDREMDLIEKWKAVAEAGLPEQERLFARNSYDDCISNLDEHLGKLLDDLEREGVLESTWLVITSDHGESFGEQAGIFLHGTSLYQPQVHVPLVVVPPRNGPKPARPVVTESVSLRDVPATVLDVLGLGADAPFPGQSLAGLWSDASGAAPDPPPRPSPALSEVVPTNPGEPDPARMVRDRRAWASLAEGDLIYIQVRGRDGLREELFDLREDPLQRRDLSRDPAHRPLLDGMRGRLERATAGPLTPGRFRL